LYLIPSLAHRLARTASDRGDNFIVTERAPHQALHPGNFLVLGNKKMRHNVWAEVATRNDSPEPSGSPGCVGRRRMNTPLGLYPRQKR
jgi:hypothetical protein